MWNKIRFGSDPFHVEHDPIWTLARKNIHVSRFPPCDPGACFCETLCKLGGNRQFLGVFRAPSWTFLPRADKNAWPRCMFLQMWWKSREWRLLLSPAKTSQIWKVCQGLFENEAFDKNYFNFHADSSGTNKTITHTHKHLLRRGEKDETSYSTTTQKKYKTLSVIRWRAAAGTLVDLRTTQASECREVRIICRSTKVRGG